MAVGMVFGGGAIAPAVGADGLVQSVSVGSVKLVQSARSKVTVTVHLGALDPGYSMHENYATIRPETGEFEPIRIDLAEVSPGVLQGSTYLTNDAKPGKWWIDDLSLWIDYEGGGYTYYGSTSPASFYVKRATTLTVNASPEPVTKGKTITVAGKLTKLSTGDASVSTDAHYVAYPGATVKIYFDPAGSATKTYMGSATTTSTGAFSKKFTAKVDGTWTAEFAGAAAYFSVKSAGDDVDVK